MKRYEITGPAQADMREILDYLRRQSPQTEELVARRLEAAMRRLARFPGLGHRREDLTRFPLRFLPVASYYIIYLPDTRPLQIVRVIHSARDLQALLREPLR